MKSSCATARRSAAPRSCATSFTSFTWAARTPANATSTLTSELPGNVLSMSLDPNNVTLEAEHFADVDPELFAPRKPLLWFWQMFDRSPIGLNHWLGLRFRCMLGRHIFDHMGSGVKIYSGVDLTYGYNLSIGDGVTIRQRALLNDRGGIKIGKNAVIGSFSRIFSHSYPPDDLDHVKLVPTHHRRRRAHRHPRDRDGRNQRASRAKWWASSRPTRHEPARAPMLT